MPTFGEVRGTGGASLNEWRQLDVIPCINMKILREEEIETVICDFEFSRLKIWGKLHEGVFFPAYGVTEIMSKI